MQKLLKRSRALQIQIDVLYLDRGFCTTPVIEYPQRAKQSAVLVYTIRGKQGGTRQLCRGRKSYRTTYTFTAGLTVQMAVVATLVPGKDKKRRRKWLLFVLVGLDSQRVIPIFVPAVGHLLPVLFSDKHRKIAHFARYLQTPRSYTHSVWRALSSPPE